MIIALAFLAIVVAAGTTAVGHQITRDVTRLIRYHTPPRASTIVEAIAVVLYLVVPVLTGPAAFALRILIVLGVAAGTVLYLALHRNDPNRPYQRTY